MFEDLLFNINEHQNNGTVLSHISVALSLVLLIRGKAVLSRQCVFKLFNTCTLVTLLLGKLEEEM